MSTKHYTDWRSWWEGLRSCMMRAGATAIFTQLSAFLGTNGVASLDIPGLDGIAMKWKTALVTLVIQFLIHTGIASAKYIQDNQPKVITETTDTTFVSKDSAGVTVSQSSKTVTTTPVLDDTVKGGVEPSGETKTPSGP